MRYIGACIDEFGLLFAVADTWKPTSCNEGQLVALVQYLTKHFYTSVEIANRKVALRHLKAIWVSLNDC
jgi:hypothetical protein